MEKVDFTTKPEQARAQINAWVEKNTDRKIKNALPKDFITRKPAESLISIVDISSEVTYLRT